MHPCCGRLHTHTNDGLAPAGGGICGSKESGRYLCPAPGSPSINGVPLSSSAHVEPDAPTLL